ncbi:MAG TPA: YraN family protein [Thermoanaerobaculia bacterium]
MTPRALLDRLLAGLGRRPRRPGGPRGRGWDWEREAERQLLASGYRILERNLRLAGAEIDLIAEEGGVLCFVEVKGRSGERFGLPEDAVDAEKRRRIVRAAEAYLLRLGDASRTCRFDVVRVRVGSGGTRVDILRDAFGADEEARR